MKIIKYIISIFALIFCIGIIPEVYQNYLYVINDEFYNTTFYMQPNTDKDEMLKDIQQCADKHSLKVFGIAKQNINSYQTKIEIYANADTLAILDKEYMIKEGTFNSLFCGTTSVDLFDFCSMDNETLKKNNTFYLIGNEKDMISFKEDLVVKYAGSFPAEGGMTNRSYMQRMIITVWTVSFLLILFLTFYEVSYQKKENMIRITFGEHIGKIVLKNCIVDMVFIFAIYYILKRIFYYLSNVELYTNVTSCALSLFVLINAGLYLRIYCVDLKSAFSNVKIDTSVLSFTYWIKMFVTICVTLILATNFTVVYEAIKYYNQKDFYEKYKDYSYIQFGTSNDMNVNSEVIDDAACLFYQTHFNKSDIIGLTQDIILKDKSIAVANYNSWKYLVSQIPELSDIECDNRNLLFVPTSYVLSKEDELFLSSYFEDSENYDIITYSSKANIVVQDSISVYESTICESPIIVFDGRNGFSEEEIQRHDYELLFSSNQLIVNVTEKGVEKFLSDYGFSIDFVSTNVMERFEYNWLVLKRSMILNIIISILFVILDLLVNGIIVKLEYQICAIELSLKKILGYSVIERNKQLFLMTGIFNILSLIVALVVCKFNYIGNLVLVIIGDAILLILQFSVIIINATKLEKENVNKILKGGCL